MVVWLGCILGVLLKGNGGFVWGNGFAWPWLHNAAAKREHCGALRVLRHGKSHQQISAAFSGGSVQSPVCHTHQNRHGKSNFRHCTRQQRATESLSSFLPQNVSAPALSSTNALPVGSVESQLSRERARRQQQLLDQHRSNVDLLEKAMKMFQGLEPAGRAGGFTWREKGSRETLEPLPGPKRELGTEFVAGRVVIGQGVMVLC